MHSFENLKAGTPGFQPGIFGILRFFYLIDFSIPSNFMVLSVHFFQTTQFYKVLSCFLLIKILLEFFLKKENPNFFSFPQKKNVPTLLIFFPLQSSLALQYSLRCLLCAKLPYIKELPVLGTSRNPSLALQICGRGGQTAGLHMTETLLFRRGLEPWPNPTGASHVLHVKESHLALVATLWLPLLQTIPCGSYRNLYGAVSWGMS